MQQIARLLGFILLTNICFAIQGAELTGEPVYDENCRQLSDGQGMTVWVMKPDASTILFSGVRFCPLAVVTQVRLNNIDFCYVPRPYNRETASPGLVSDFDSETTPPGYDAAPEEGEFIKIGVGALRRPVADAPGGRRYTFSAPYELISPAVNTVEWFNDRAKFRQYLPQTEQGYSYILTAEVRISANQLYIDWSLENTGEKRFSTTTYSHNSFAFAPAGQVAATIGAEYSLSVPFAARAWYGKKGQWLTPLDDKSEYYTFVDGVARLTSTLDGYANCHISAQPEADRSQFLTIQGQGGATVRFKTTPQPRALMMLHASPWYFCPEQFLLLDIGPGDIHKWRREYEFFAK